MEGYYFDQLTLNQKKAYSRIKDGLKAMKDKIAVEDLELPDRDGNMLFQTVMAENPDLFWVDAYIYRYATGTPGNTISFFEPVYVMNQRQRENAQAELDEAVSVYLKGITKNTGEYKTARLLYERVIDALDFDSLALERERKQGRKIGELDELRNIYTALVEKKSTCVGYAKAYQYLLQKAGIENLLVTGKLIYGGSHVWNMAKLDGNYYHIDVTWGDFSNTDPLKSREGISYKFFAVSDQDILPTHIPEEAVKLPKCYKSYK